MPAVRNGEKTNLEVFQRNETEHRTNERGRALNDSR